MENKSSAAGRNSLIIRCLRGYSSIVFLTSLINTSSPSIRGIWDAVIGNDRPYDFLTDFCEFNYPLYVLTTLLIPRAPPHGALFARKQLYIKTQCLHPSPKYQQQIASSSYSQYLGSNLHVIKSSLLAIIPKSISKTSQWLPSSPRSRRSSNRGIELSQLHIRRAISLFSLKI